MCKCANVRIKTFTNPVIKLYTQMRMYLIRTFANSHIRTFLMVCPFYRIHINSLFIHFPKRAHLAEFQNGF
jgi:hypothetical protein